MRVTGYCLISSAHQNIDRQVRNVLKEYLDAEIIKEVYTGTKFQNKFKRILAMQFAAVSGHRCGA